MVVGRYGQLDPPVIETWLQRNFSTSSVTIIMRVLDFNLFWCCMFFPKKTEKLLELTKIDIADCLILATLFWATSNILFSSIRSLLYIINREFDLTSIMSHGFRSSNLRIFVCNKRHQRYVTNVATHLESDICIIARIARICINFTEESKIKITVKSTSYLSCRWTLP